MMRTPRSTLLIAGLACLLLGHDASAQEDKQAEQKPAAKDADSAAKGSTAPVQQVVTAGIYLNQIDGMSLKEQKVAVDFHIWFRWKGDDVKPIETFDLANGQIDSKEDVYEATHGDTHYAVCRCLATIQKLWDVRRFPLDSHEVTIEIEDNDREEDLLQYVPDTENSNLNPDARVAGWDLSFGGAKVVTHTFNTNFGDISRPTGNSSDWSRFVYTARMLRPGYGYFGKLFTGLFVAAAIALISLLTQPAEIDSRFGLGVGAMFAAVASEYLVTAALPDSNLLSLADRLHIVTFLLIFLALAESSLSHKLFGSGQQRTSWVLDRISFVGLSVIYAGIVIYMIVVK
jgi:hypothetical protein